MNDKDADKYMESLDATFDGEIEDLDLPEDLKQRAIEIRDAMLKESTDESDDKGS